VPALRRAEGGMAVADVCGKLGASEQGFYRWSGNTAGWQSLSGDPCGSVRMRTSAASGSRPT
jgi:hypothetical protein